MGTTLLCEDDEDIRLLVTLLLEGAGRRFNRHTTAIVMGETVLSPPSMWLARPTRTVPKPARGARYHLRVRTPPGTTFVTGLFRKAGAADTYAIDNLDVSPYSGFANFDVAEVKAGGGTVEVAVAPGARTLSPDAIRAWVQRCAALIAGYYGRATNAALGGTGTGTFGGGHNYSATLLAEYSLSKRTEVYGTVDYTRGTGAYTIDYPGKNNQTGVAVGLRNIF